MHIRCRHCLEARDLIRILSIETSGSATWVNSPELSQNSRRLASQVEKSKLTSSLIVPCCQRTMVSNESEGCAGLIPQACEARRAGISMANMLEFPGYIERDGGPRTSEQTRSRCGNELRTTQTPMISKAGGEKYTLDST